MQLSGNQKRPHASSPNPQSSFISEKFTAAKAEMPTEIHIRTPVKHVQILSVFLSQNLKTHKYEGA